MIRTICASLAVSLCFVLIGPAPGQPARLAAAGHQAQPGNPAGAPSQYRAVLDKYCVSCHNGKLRAAGGLALDTVDLANVSRHGDVLESVARKIRLRDMPPAGQPRPDPAVYQSFAVWLEGSLDAAAKTSPNPGRPSLHRLNRTEYANAVRDLLGLEIDATTLLPADDSTHGFDNIADVLGVSPDLLESFVTAGRKISRLAIGNPTIAPISETYGTAPDTNQDDHLEGLPFGTRGGLLVNHYFPLDGEYEIRVRLTRGSLDQVRGLLEPHDVELALDGSRARLFSLDGGEHMYFERYYNADTPSLHGDDHLHLRVPVKAGTRTIWATFPLRSDALGEEMLETTAYTKAPGSKGLPMIEGITVTGPYAAARPEGTPGRRILTCRPVNLSEELPCAKKILSAFARRAYRGNVTQRDLQSLLEFYERGRQTGGFDSGIEMAVWRILAAPQFVFRFESDPKKVAPGAAYRISDIELASRLSFFLWSSIPDDRLLTLASRGELSTPAVLEREVRRMLADPRSGALVENFARQWLSLQKMETVHPDPGRFPDFDDTLRQALKRETELLFDHVMREDRSVLELLTANYSFLNERLARHYGIPNVLGSRFRRVAVPEYRRGLLGHASILTVASFPTRTSPVLRGKWLLETLIGSPPPPPPPNVPALNEREKDGSGKVLTMRDRMVQHRANPVCASCHSRMDPLGLALEPFDAVGRWRTETVDASGALQDGTKFDGPAGLREALMLRPEVFVNTLTEKLFTYALGRGLAPYDAAAVRAAIRESAPSKHAFSSLVLGVVKSVPFQMRKAAEDSSSPAPVPVAAR